MGRNPPLADVGSTPCAGADDNRYSGRVTWTRSRKWTVAVLTVVIAMAVIAIGGRRMAADRLLVVLRQEVDLRLGLEVRAGGVSLSLVDGTARLVDVTVLDGAATIFECESIEVDGRVMDVLRDRFECAKLVVLRPVLRVVMEENGRTNLQRILDRARTTRAAGGRGNVVLLRAGDVEDGRIEIVDALTDPDAPLRVELRGLRATVRDWQPAGEPALGSPTDLRVDGVIDQPGVPCRVSVVAWQSPPGEASRATVLAAITGFDLRGIPRYVGAAELAALGGDLMHFDIDIRIRDGVLGPGAIVGEVVGPGTVLPMRIGGTTAVPVFDTGSPLATLFRVPFGRVGQLGRVTLDAGWSTARGGAGAVAEVGGGVVDAGASLGAGLVHAGGDVLSGDPLGALSAAGEGALGAVSSLGGGIVDGASSLLGGGTGAVDAITGGHPAEIRRLFDERHAARRITMLRAALASATGAEEGTRRSRIEGELRRSAPLLDSSVPR